jgi:hypothetical protein
MENSEKPMTDWTQTFTGRQFHTFAPNPDSIAIEDIAHALSLQCRFAGHCREHYSVAEHSVRVALTLKGIQMQLCGLLHDAAEAYLVDLPSPIKAKMRDYQNVEFAVQQVISKRYTVPLSLPEEVKQADLILLATEKRDLMAKEPAPWIDLPVPLKEKITPWTPKQAESNFLALFKKLTQINQRDLETGLSLGQESVAAQ